MGLFFEGYWGKYCLLQIEEMSTKAFIKRVKTRSDVAVTKLKLIQKQ
jgi:hypothetical protein